MPTLSCMTLPYTHYQHSFERALNGIRDAGYKYVSFSPGEAGVAIRRTPIDLDEVKSVRTLCEQYSLVPDVLYGVQIMQQDLPTLCRHIDFAAELGVRLLVWMGPFSYHRFGYYQFPCDLKSDHEQRIDHAEFLIRIKPVAEYAARRGVTITFKPHTGNAATGPILANTLRDVDSRWVKGCYDPGNVAFYESVAPEEDILAIRQEIVCLIAKDQRGGQANVDFPVPGEGDIDFVRILQHLRDVGFEGPIVVERLNGTGQDPLTLDDLDVRVLAARLNLERMLTTTGYAVPA